MKLTNFVAAVLVTVLMTNSILAGGFGKAQLIDLQQAGLVEIDSRYFDEVYGKVPTSLEQVKDVYIEGLQTDDIRFNEPHKTGWGRKNAWYLTDTDHEWLQGQYYKYMVEAIEAVDGYTVVTEPSHDVLTIKAALIELSPLAPRDDNRSRPIFADFYSKGTGDLKIAIEVSYENETQLTLLDERAAGQAWERNDKFQSRRNVIRVFDRWALNLVDQLNMN